MKIFFLKKKEIVEFSELFDISLIDQIVHDLSQISDISQTIELLSHLTCFDLYKLDLIKNFESLKKLFEKTSKELLETPKNKNNVIFYKFHKMNFNIKIIKTNVLIFFFS